MKQRLTTSLIKALPRPANSTRRRRIFDTEIRGFYVEIRCTTPDAAPAGSYAFRYHHRGRQRTVTIGRLADITLGQARDKAQKLRAAVTLGEDPAAERDRVRAIPTLDTFLAERLMPHVREHNRSAATYEGFCRRLTTGLGRRHLDQVTPGDIDGFRKALIADGLKPATVNRHLAFVRMAFNKARAWGYLDGPNPAAAPGMLPEEHRERYLTPDEGKRLLATLAEDYDRPAAVAVALLMLTGARRSEILTAKWEWLDFEQKLLRVPRTKSGRSHHIPLSAATVRLLLDYRGPRRAVGYIFPGRAPGKPLTTLRGIWDRAKAGAALPADLRLHDLRHTFASTLANRGIPLNEVAVILGHRQLATTARYAHFAAHRLAATAGIAADAWGLDTPLTLPGDAHG